MKRFTLDQINKLGKWKQFKELMKRKRDIRDFDVILNRLPDYPIDLKISDLTELNMIDLKPMEFNGKK